SLSIPRNLWITTPNAWQPLVDRETFDRAQQHFLDQTFYKTDDELLRDLKKLLIEKGELSARLVNEAPNLPSIMAYQWRFGSLTAAFSLLGYKGRRAEGMAARQNTLMLRDNLIRNLVACATARLTIVRR